MSAPDHEQVNPQDSAPPRRELAELRIMEAMIASSLSAMLIADLAGFITYINPAFLQLWGYERREEILGRQLADFVLDREQAVEMLQPLRAHGAWAGEHVAVCRNGALRIVQHSATVISDPVGEPVCFASSFVDITERKQVEQSLRTSEARYRNIVEAVPVGITLTDEQGTIMYYSAQAREMFGVADDQVALGANYRAWIAEGQACAARGDTGGDPGRTPRTELRLRRADQTEFWGEVTAVLLEDPYGGQDRGSLIVVQDISDRKAANEALARYAAELELSNRELEQFAYVASHDLQEPLRMVASYVQLLAKDYAGHLSPEADVYIDFAVDGARRMQRLIDDLLAFSRVGTRGGAFKPVDCQAALRDVLHSLQVACEETGATITCTPLPTIMADGGQFHQLLQNLLANAIKFHGERPPAIHVSATYQPAPAGSAQPGSSVSGSSSGSSSEEGPGWTFAVHDNGIGIDPQYFERIFVIFQRLHSRAQYSGTGIGLAICKKIVERHGGRIWVESVPGQGATFYFHLPERQGAGAALRNAPHSW